LKPLDEALTNEFLTVVSVFERDRGLLEFLDGTGIRPGVRLQVLSSDEGFELETGGRQFRLDRPAASKVWVKTTSPSQASA